MERNFKEQDVSSKRLELTDRFINIEGSFNKSTEAGQVAMMVSMFEKKLKTSFEASSPSLSSSCKKTNVRNSDRKILKIIETNCGNRKNGLSENKDNESSREVKEVSLIPFRLNSILSDDGYNEVAPLAPESNNNYKDQNTTKKEKKYKPTMYDWARSVTEGDMKVSLYDALPEKNKRASIGCPASSLLRDPPPLGFNRDENAPPIKIFVGTWNTEYCEFSSDAFQLKKTDSEITADFTNRKAKEFSIPYGILSTTVPIGTTVQASELLRESFFKAQKCANQDDCETQLNNPYYNIQEKGILNDSACKYSAWDYEKRHLNETGSSKVYFSGLLTSPDTVDLQDTLNSTHDSQNNFNPIKERADKEIDYPEEYEPLSDWIISGYDVYVVALQEVISPKMYYEILTYLRRVNKRKFVKIYFNEDKISGIGDGAYLSLKSTSIACFVAEDIFGDSNKVAVRSSKGMSLSSLNGSKGAVAVILSIYDQTVCFVSCHLPTGKPEARLRARATIRSKLAETYCGFPDVDVVDIFHHIVWLGDLNLRIQEIGSEAVLHYLYRGEVDRILAFDELEYDDFNNDFRKYSFEEPRITFLPTYKKFSRRAPLDYTKQNRFHDEYNVNFKVKWYKGGKTKERVPSWSDRVLKWSHPGLRSCLIYIPGTYAAASPAYRSFLLRSDHSPVGCGLCIFPLKSWYRTPHILFGEKRTDQTKSKRDLPE